MRVLENWKVFESSELFLQKLNKIESDILELYNLYNLVYDITNNLKLGVILYNKVLNKDYGTIIIDDISNIKYISSTLKEMSSIIKDDGFIPIYSISSLLPISKGVVKRMGNVTFKDTHIKELDVLSKLYGELGDFIYSARSRGWFVSFENGYDAIVIKIIIDRV